MNKDNLIEFAKEQCEIFTEDSTMGKYLRKTLKMLQAEPCEDAISRTYLLKKFEDRFIELQKAHQKEKQLGINWCINTLKDMPPVTPTQKWIPVSERLPEVMEGVRGNFSNDVLMCVIDTDGEGTTISTGFYGYYPNCSTMKGWWCMWAYGCGKLDGKCKVVAWMPLPKAYKVEKKCCSDCKHHTDGEEIHGVTPCGSCGIEKKNFEQKARKHEQDN